MMELPDESDALIARLADLIDAQVGEINSRNGFSIRQIEENEGAARILTEIVVALRANAET